MTWNSRASRVRPAAQLGLVTAAVLLASPAVAEPPFPALAGAPAVTLDPAITPQAAPQRVRVAAARMLLRGPEAERVRAILSSGPDARGGAIIVVDVAAPFRGLDRTASPTVVLDGQLLDSYVSPNEPQRVYALVPSRLQRAAAAGNLQVGWLGDMEGKKSQPMRVPLR